VIMKSDNLKDWTYIGELLHPDFDEEKLGVTKGEDISCANMFKLGNKWILTCISHRLGCRYFIGDFKDEQYLPEFHAMMSWQGNNFFAPESMLSQDGRRVMWAWVRRGANPTGVQSLPRELELPEDGVLQIKPLRELQSLRYDEKVEKMMVVVADKEARLETLAGDAIELEITFAAPLPKEFGLKLLGDENGENSMSIVAGAEMKKLMVGNLDPEFALKKDEDLTLQVFIDKNLVEVFANNRQAAVYPHEHFRDNPNISLFTEDSDLVVKEIKTWKMKSIYKPAE
jgi:beta-fructofuranosidase